VILEQLRAFGEHEYADSLTGSFNTPYFNDLINNPFESYLTYISVPMLVMQGANDFQVLADTDFVLLRELLGDRDDVTFKLYEGLDHLFMPSSATNIIEHRDQMVAHPVGTSVDGQVLRDIAEWILSGVPR
jgi:hypothetical protein